jgi:hypothetical protein
MVCLPCPALLTFQITFIGRSSSLKGISKKSMQGCTVILLPSKVRNLNIIYFMRLIVSTKGGVRRGARLDEFQSYDCFDRSDRYDPEGYLRSLIYDHHRLRSGFRLCHPSFVHLSHNSIIVLIIACSIHSSTSSSILSSPVFTSSVQLSHNPFIDPTRPHSVQLLCLPSSVQLHQSFIDSTLFRSDLRLRLHS